MDKACWRIQERLNGYRGVIRLARRFLMFQKDSAARWYRTRTEGPSGARKTSLLALVADPARDRAQYALHDVGHRRSVPLFDAVGEADEVSAPDIDEPWLPDFGMLRAGASERFGKQLSKLPVDAVVSGEFKHGLQILRLGVI